MGYLTGQFACFRHPGGMLLCRMQMQSVFIFILLFLQPASSIVLLSSIFYKFYKIIMKLKQYLKNNDISPAEFSRLNRCVKS